MGKGEDTFSRHDTNVCRISVCASHPWWVLLCGAIFVIACSCGILFLKITTDPVELWASPDSQSRREKTYFDRNFEPFYRTEQIIVTSVDLPNVSIYQNSIDSKAVLHILHLRLHNTFTMILLLLFSFNLIVPHFDDDDMLQSLP